MQQASDPGPPVPDLVAGPRRGRGIQLRPPGRPGEGRSGRGRYRAGERAASFTSFTGGDSAPGLALELDADPIAGFYGVLSDRNDPTAHGKLDDYEELVLIRTETSGDSSSTIALK
jgi:hypothetical protein